MQYMRVYAPVDLDAIVFNLESMRKNIDRETGMLGVIKADAYGHGSVPVAAAIEDYVMALRWPPQTKPCCCAATAFRR